MKVLFDNEKFTTDSHGGVVRYFVELMRYYEAMPNIEYDLPIASSKTEYLIKLPRFKKLKPPKTYNDFLPGIMFRGKWRLYCLWRRLLSRWDNKNLILKALRKRRFDVLHPTYYDTTLLEHLGNKPYVLTIHDMIHEMFLQELWEIDTTTVDKRIMAEKASRIIAVSENTKRDIIRILGISPNKIDVVYHGNSLVPRKEDLSTRPVNAPASYLLFVGARIRYKNFLRFVKSISPLLQDILDLHLVCIGQNSFSEDEVTLFADLNIKDKVHLFSATDSELVQYYAHATAFVFPSLYEGFGIPVLESFACGCPAIISKTSSLSEIGQNAVTYFDPISEESIYNAVYSVINSPELRKKMIAEGYKQLERFSWDRAAKQTVEVYQRAIDEYNISTEIAV